MKNAFKNKRLNVLIADGALLVLALFAKRIAALMIKHIPPCVFLERGILCPSCGGTRCIQSFFSGDISEAFYYNAYFAAMIFYVAAVLILINLYCLFDIKKMRKIIRVTAGKETIITLAVGFIIFGIVRAIIRQ